MSQPPAIFCPSCGRANVTSTEGLARCNDCGQQFLVQTHEPHPIENAGTLDYRDPPDDSELSELRIRNVSNLRRGAYRERSYWIIAAALCIVGAAKLVQIGYIALTENFLIASIGDSVGAVATLVLFTATLRKISALTRELNSSGLAAPAQPPDFSNLGDGTQRLRDLESLTNPTDPNPP